MRLVLALRAAVVITLAAGVQAGICKPSAASYASLQSQPTTFESFQSAAVPASVSPDVVIKPETGASLSATTFPSPEEEPEATGPSAFKTACTSCILHDEKISALVSTAQQENSIIQTCVSSPTTTSAPESIPSTILEQQVTLPVSTIIASRTFTSQTCRITDPVTSSCASRPSLVCGETGLFNDSEANLISLFQYYDLVRCKAECEGTENCLAIGFTTGRQCELYDASVSDMKFEAKDQWYYSVYDAGCFEVEG
jgi:hypothetical protein